MKNLTMQHKLKKGYAVDLSSKPRTPEGWVLLDQPLEFGRDYCLADTENWLWWCWRLKDGRIVAGIDPCRTPGWAMADQVLWLR